MAEQFINDASTTLAAPMTANQTTLTVASGSQFPAGGTFRIRIDNEVMTVTAVSGVTWTVTRASESCVGAQVAATHVGGSPVTAVLTAGALATMSGTGTIQSITTGTGLTGGVITVTGTIALADTAVTPASYTNANVTVDQQGRITAASSGSAGGVTSFNTRTGTVTLTSGDVTTALGFTPIQTITLSGDVSGSGSSAITLTIGAGKVTNAMLAGSVSASKLVGTDIATVGTITSGTWNGTIIGVQYGGTGIDTSGYTLGQMIIAQGSGVWAADSRRGFLAGSGAPASGLGYPGDSYIDLLTGDVYQKS